MRVGSFLSCVGSKKDSLAGSHTREVEKDMSSPHQVANSLFESIIRVELKSPKCVKVHL